MLEGVFAENVLTHPNVRPYPQQPQETSGYYVGTQAIFRYSLKDSDYPTLIITDPLFDNAGGVINSGYYELALSDMRDFLILIQSKNPVAVIPVIKIEEDATEAARLNNKKVKKYIIMIISKIKKGVFYMKKQNLKKEKTETNEELMVNRFKKYSVFLRF